MNLDLSAEERTAKERYRAFSELEIVPQAARFDQEGRLPRSLFEKMAKEGWLDAHLPKGESQKPQNAVALGLLHQELGRACPSVSSVLTVHQMVAAALSRWGQPALKQVWLPGLASGQALAAFALSEPEVGSDAAGIQTRIEEQGGVYVIQGVKKWISGGQMADLFLVLGQCQGSLLSLLVPRATPGLEMVPIANLLGMRASMLAELRFNSCKVPLDNIVGRVGFGFSAVVNQALDWGRFFVAWNCVGIAQACLEASLAYIGRRRQFGALLQDHALVQQMISDMLTEFTASQGLCFRAAFLRDKADAGSVVQTLMAKYHASRMVNRVAQQALQLHGANGYCSDFPLERHLRDARAMEIIEGSTQVLQMAIAKNWRGEF